MKAKRWRNHRSMPRKSQATSPASCPPYKLCSPTRCRLPTCALATLIIALPICSESPSLLAVEDQTPEVNLSLKLTPEQINPDLDQLAQILKDRWIVANIGNPDFDAAINDVRRKSAKGLTVAEFTIELQEIISLGSDGHAGVTPFGRLIRQEPGYLPFVMNLCQGRFIAYTFDSQPNVYLPRKRYRTRLLRDTHPYITKMDSIPIEQWIDKISPLVSKGPKHAVQWRCLAMFGFGTLPFFRDRLGLPQRDKVTVTLASDHPLAEPIDIELPLAKHQVFPFKIPKPHDRLLPGNLGYMWIRNTASGGAETVIKAMPKFRKTDGLIVDLRDNRGGNAFETLQILTAYLLDPKTSPRIVGASVSNKMARLGQGDGTVLASDPAMTSAERNTLNDFLPEFKLQWSPPANHEAQWGYVMLYSRP